MAWDIEYTDEFESWWENLTAEAQIDVDTVVGLLEECGPNLPFPYSVFIGGKRFKALPYARVADSASRPATAGIVCF
jgi:hypothetical protein